MESKACFKCGEIKPLADFYKHSQMSDGRVGKCKSCNKADVIANRLSKIEHYREYDRGRGNRQGYNYIKEYRAKYPNKYKAHSIVNYAIKAKKLFKEPCEVCGVDEGIHAHHDDYAKPLNVRWLCPAHHKEWHTKNGSAKNAF
tara:strand:- start:40 stop:468 length:429 start_codon:yes stop_codon:yes gene_type:complete